MKIVEADGSVSLEVSDAHALLVLPPDGRPFALVERVDGVALDTPQARFARALVSYISDPDNRAHILRSHRSEKNPQHRHN